MCLLFSPFWYHIWAIGPLPFGELCYTSPAFLPEPVNMMTRQSQVIIHTPQLPTRRAQAGLNGSAYLLRSCSFEPGAATPNGAQRMSIAVAKFGPAIHFSIGSHRQAICIDATKAGIPRLYTIKPDIPGCENTIQHLALATVTEDGIERVCNYRKPSLHMHQVNAALHTQIRRNAFFNKERQHVAFAGTHFFSYNKVKAIVFLLPEISGSQGTFHDVMIGDRDYIQVGIKLDMVQDLLYSANPVTVSTLHIQITSSPLS